MEQQEPWGQFPQIVPPYAAPQVPLVVGAPPVALPVAVGLPRTGSCVVDAILVMVLLGTVQPF